MSRLGRLGSDIKGNNRANCERSKQ